MAVVRVLGGKFLEVHIKDSFREMLEKELYREELFSDL